MTQRTETSIDIDAIERAIEVIEARAIGLGAKDPRTSAWDDQREKLEDAHTAAMDLIYERLGFSND